MLDSIKDPNTGKIKTPILISIIGAVGLVVFLFMSKGSVGGVTATGQSSPLTPDLTGLQDALKGLASNNSSGGGGGTTSSPTLDPPPGFGSVSPISYTDPTPSPITTPAPSTTTSPEPTKSFGGMSGGNSLDTVTRYLSGPLTLAPGDNGNSGGGGSGLVSVPTPVSSVQTVYGGIATPTLTAPSRIYEPVTTPAYTPIPSPSPGIMVTPTGTPITVGGMTISTIALPPIKTKSGGGTWDTPVIKSGTKSGGGSWGTPIKKPKAPVTTPKPAKPKYKAVAI